MMVFEYIKIYKERMIKESNSNYKSSKVAIIGNSKGS